MRASYTLVALTFALPLLSTATASAHFGLTAPPSTKPADKNGKGAPPCGPDTTAGGTPMAVQGGHDMDLSLDETTAHPGFYRVALSLHPLSEIYAGGKVPTPGMFFPVDNVVQDKDGNVLPADKSTGVQSATAVLEDGRKYPATGLVPNPVFPVLAGNLFAHTGAPMNPWTAKVKLPNVNCDRCTLQVIEFMAEHGFNSSDPPLAPGGGYFYHHCAEIKITADAGMPIFDPTAPSGGTGGMGGTAGTAGTPTVTAGTGGTGGSGGSGGVSTGGTGIGTAGTPTTAGAAATTAGAPGTAGAATTAGTAGTGAAQDDSSCGIAKNSRGTASALAALGILFALGRRRRAR